VAKFYLALVLSLGIHGLILWTLPNPISNSNSDRDLEIIGLLPIVDLPPATITKPEQLPLIPPVSDPLSVPPLDLTTKIPAPPDDFPIDLSFEKIIAPPKPRLDPLPPKALPPLDKPPPIPPEPKEEIPDPKPPSPIALDPSAYTQEFANIYSELSTKCGIDNVIRLTIPHPEEEVTSQISEVVAEDVPWIPPVYSPTEILADLEITIPVTLVVDSDGQISQRRFISSNIAVIDGIILQTIDLYEGKFKPLPGKCRLVTTKYKFSNK